MVGTSRDASQRLEQIRRRLRRASFRLEMALLERTWAAVSASRQGMSVRQIAEAVGLSPTRVHQIVTDSTGYPLDEGLSVLRELGWPAAEDEPVDPDSVAARMVDEAAVLTECGDWLDKLGPDAVRQPRINVRPDDDWPDTNVVAAEFLNFFGTGRSWIQWVGVSSSGLLIHAAPGSGGGVGGLRTNRSGWVW